jgi:hypothetical protein
MLGLVLLAAVSTTLSAQSESRRMTIVGAGGSERGKCTIEVVVDGAAEVEISGDTAKLRNLGGSAPHWRRFECTGPLPRNPGDFRFAGVDGRGQQQLVRDPRDGGSAVIRIGDPDNGSEGYTFDIMWSNAPPIPDRGRGDDRRFDRQGADTGRPDDLGRGPDRDADRFYRDRSDDFRGDSWRMHLFARIERDLDHIQTVTFPFGSDQYRLSRAKQELNQLQDLQARGRYARRQLDDVLATLKTVVTDNRMTPRDRDILNEDVSRLLDFRAHFREYGVQ